MSELAKKTTKVKALSAELRRKEKALAEAAALLVSQKKPMQSGGTTRKADLVENRKMVVELTCEAHEMGARYSACVAELGISIRTFERWRMEGGDAGDKRQGPRTTISNEKNSALGTLP